MRIWWREVLRLGDDTPNLNCSLACRYDNEFSIPSLKCNIRNLTSLARSLSLLFTTVWRPGLLREQEELTFAARGCARACPNEQQAEIRDWKIVEVLVVHRGYPSYDRKPHALVIFASFLSFILSSVPLKTY